MRKPPSELLPNDDDDDDDDDDNDQSNPNQSEPPRELGFKIQIRQQRYVKADNNNNSNNNNKIINEEEAAATIEFYIRWIWGLDSALFESFYGMLRKNIFSRNFN